MASEGFKAYRKPLILILVILFVSPLFGVVLADMVGYHEPLDLAAESLKLRDFTEDLNWTPFLDYSVPGLPAELGYIIAGFLGVSIILGLGFLLSRMAKA